MKTALCKFTYTSKEYRTAYALYRRCRGLAAYKFFAVIMVILILVVSWGAYDDYLAGPSPDDEVSLPVKIMSEYLILLIPILIGVIFTIPLGSRTLTLNALWQQFFAFRKSLACGVSFQNEATDEGIKSVSSATKSELKWSIMSQAMENRDGFIILLTSRQFLWLPKHGFASSGDIDLCRSLIRDHIKKFRAIG